MDLDVTSTLQQILEAHSVAVKPQGQSLVAGEAEMSAWIFRQPSVNLTNLLQLDVRVNSPLIGNRTLIESFAGWGRDEPEATRQAWEKFCRSSLHVLLEVFIGDKKGEDQIEWETWEKSGVLWRVCLGPLFVLGFGDQPVPRIACGDLIDRIRDTLLPAASRAGHWLRLYYMRHANSRVGSECLLDNEMWPEGQDLVDQWNCPDGAYSIRFFLILLPSFQS